MPYGVARWNPPEEEPWRGSEARLTKEWGNVIPIFIARFANVLSLLCAFWWPPRAWEL